MNNYSLNADSRRWWWPSAAAGTAVVAAISALVIPATGHAIPVDHTPAGVPIVSLVDDDAGTHPCFMVRSRWNTALDGPQPVCGR